MYLLTSLPSEVAVDIITKWVTVKELLAVDTSYCSTAQRPIFLNILNCSRCILPMFPLEGGLKAKYYGWLNMRGVRSSHYELHSDFLSRDGEYLMRFGRLVSSVTMKSVRTGFASAAALVYNNCKELKAFECKDCLIDNSLCRLLATLRGITELRLDDLQRMQIDPNDLLVIVCPNIDTLCLNVRFKNDKGAKTALVAAFVRICPNLTKCAIHEFPLLEHLGVRIFTKQCRKLKRLALTTESSYVQVTDKDLISLGKCCPKLKHLDVSGSEELTDRGIFRASPLFPRLRSICLVETSIGDRGVRGLAHSCPHLEAVFLRGENHTITPSSINDLLFESPGLTTLSFCFQDNESYFDEIELELLENLTTLHVHRPPPDFLAELPQHCPLLQTLYCTDADSLEGLEEVIMHSSNLRQLRFSDMAVPEFTRERWQFLRPNLACTQDEYVYDALTFNG